MSEYNIYIDRVFADVEHRSGMPVYIPKNVSSSIDSKKINKWTIQLTNGGSAECSLANIILVVKTYYIDTKNIRRSIEKKIYFKSLSIKPNASIFIGNFLIQHALNEYVTSTSNIKYISDQISGNNIVVSTVFSIITTDDIVIDVLGSVTNFNSGYNSSVVLSAITKNMLQYIDNSWNYATIDKLSGCIQKKINTYSTVYSVSEWKFLENKYKCAINNFTASYIIGGCNVLSLRNTHFLFNKTGYFRLFDSVAKDDTRLFININVQYPNYPRWEQLGYASEVYIKFMDNTIILNTGFRGNRAYVVNNNGFEYRDALLDFDDTALRYSCNTRFSSSDENKIEEHLQNNPSDEIPELIRNIIIINISDNYSVHVENVNRFNLQPCRIKLMIDNSAKSNKNTGILADSKYFAGSQLQSLIDDSYLSGRKSISGIVQTEDSIYINKKWE